MINISELKPNPNNPRIIKDAKFKKLCIVCSKEFKTKPCHYDFRRTCSFKCRAVLNKRDQSGKNHPLFSNGLSVKQIFSCKGCGKDFISDKGYTGRTPKYCSSKCFGVKIGSGLPKSDQQVIRASKEYYHWRKNVYLRDNYTCQMCNTRGGKLHADHIKPFAFFPELRLDISNGRTLCVSCHIKTDTFGHKALNLKNAV